MSGHRSVLVLPFLLSGCVALLPRAPESSALGTTSSGFLTGASVMPEQGEGFVRARRGEATRFGTPRLVGALTRAMADVARTFPGSQPMRVGDLSYPDGGRHPRHHSHRAGRDADLLFYLTDATGRPVPSRGWLAFSRFGHAVDDSGAVFLFDDARNWHFVRTLLVDDDAEVQWIFCSRGVKSRLLRYAAEHEPSPEIVARAAYVLHQPERAAPHDDHFHVRVFCSAEERSLGCADTGPRWPWLRPDVEEIAGEGGRGLDDTSLLALFLDGDPDAD